MSYSLINFRVIVCRLRWKYSPIPAPVHRDQSHNDGEAMVIPRTDPGIPARSRAAAWRRLASSAPHGWDGEVDCQRLSLSETGMKLALGHKNPNVFHFHDDSV